MCDVREAGTEGWRTSDKATGMQGQSMSANESTRADGVDGGGVGYTEGPGS